ncbi:hypothetical protein OGATHE_000631 [Ogataea polymorpha]|uniref:Uncharacterized protein n=1 Tax=Ogataea polymorpha TaxID=460523 RepID=A0A9P8TGY2_9ASCO|nr:hypothetical protein OGATHE_000631 [Ogataea polymorpha]
MLGRRIFLGLARWPGLTWKLDEKSAASTEQVGESTLGDIVSGLLSEFVRWWVAGRRGRDLTDAFSNGESWSWASALVSDWL